MDKRIFRLILGMIITALVLYFVGMTIYSNSFILGIIGLIGVLYISKQLLKIMVNPIEVSESG